MARFSPAVLAIDPVREVEKITDRMRRQMASSLKRRGAVVGLSGGIDSSVTAALAVKAFGEERVMGLEMPERHSAAETVTLSTLVAESLGIRTERHDITPLLEAAAFYQKYDDAVRMVIPEYGAEWQSKLVIQGSRDRRSYSAFFIVAQGPDGVSRREGLSLHPYLAIVAATNFKQRIRKMLEYYHADRHNYAVLGTPNRLEYDQGFFVKLGDGAADMKPIAHLYKTQVYQLATYLGIPDEIRRRPPTTDTYSLAQGQDEFYFALPYEKMDLCLYGHNHGVPSSEVAEAVGMSGDEVEGVYREIEAKRIATRYLHLPPLLVEEIAEVGHGR